MNTDRSSTISMADVQRACSLLPGQILATDPAMTPERFAGLYNYHHKKLLSSVITTIISYYIRHELYYTEPVYYCSSTSSMTHPKNFYQKIC